MISNRKWTDRPSQKIKHSEEFLRGNCFPKAPVVSNRYIGKIMLDFISNFIWRLKTHTCAKTTSLKSCTKTQLFSGAVPYCAKQSTYQEHPVKKLKISKQHHKTAKRRCHGFDVHKPWADFPMVEPDVGLNEKTEAAGMENDETQNAEIVWSRVSNDIDAEIVDRFARN